MPEAWQILGLPLRAFSLGHYKLLKRHGCGFVGDGEVTASREDLLLGVLICSMPPSEFQGFIDKPDYLKDVEEWGKTVGLFDLNEKAILFKEYLDAHSSMPPYWEENAGGKSGAHWAHSVEVCLRSKLGWTQNEIDSHPLSKAFADYLKHAENEGAIKLMTAEEIETINGKEADCGT